MQIPPQAQREIDRVETLKGTVEINGSEVVVNMPFQEGTGIPETFKRRIEEALSRAEIKSESITFEPKSSTDTDIKKFYLPYDLYANCPTCGDRIKWNNYLCYPTYGEPENIHFYCDECEDDFTKTIVIGLKVEEVTA